MEVIVKIEVVNGDRLSNSKETKEINGSIYSRYFDECCPGWNNDPTFNRLYLENLETYCDDILHHRGYIFLNEVYDKLGLPKTKIGQLVGWVYDEQDPVGDNHVDFGLNEKINSDFINGLTNRPLLDFNVDGEILSKL